MTAALAPYVATRAQLGLRIFRPALGVLPAPHRIEFDEDDQTATITLAPDKAHHVDAWVRYLQGHDVAIVHPPAAAGGSYRAVVAWDGWTVTITCTDLGAECILALDRAVAATRAARGVA